MRYITKEDKTVAALTVLSVIALMGVVMLPGAVADDADCYLGLVYYMGKNGASAEQQLAVGVAGAIDAVVWNAAVGFAFGGPAGTAAGIGATF